MNEEEAEACVAGADLYFLILFSWSGGRTQGWWKFGHLHGVGLQVYLA